MGNFYWKIGLILYVMIINASEEPCPQKCSCKRTANEKDGVSLKITCGEKNKVIHLDELELMSFSNELVQLNLSENNLTSFAPKVELLVLQKLDLSKNQLNELYANQFFEIPNLKRLDLSQNVIRHIHLDAFSNLKHLERLKLNHNQISVITQGTFMPLVLIKQLDISNNPLVCDCSLLWILDWSQKYSVKLLSNPKCSEPVLFRNHLLKKLKIGDDIHCESPAGRNGLPVIELKPAENQIVFEGDSLTLQCLAPSISDSYVEPPRSKVEWLWLESDPKQSFSDLRVENQVLPSAGRISSTLVITKVNKSHTGIWECFFMSLQANHSKGLTVTVISKDTRYCPITLTSNNKGTYNWPKTIVNNTVTLPCQSLHLNYDISSQRASYFCSENGEWVNLNTSRCSYTSDTTKILEQFSKVNSSIEESAKHFRNYTLNRTIFKDIMDLVFAVFTIENYIKYAPVESAVNVGNSLIDVINNLMELPRFYIRETDLGYGICNKLLEAMKNLVFLSSSTNFYRSNFALENFPVKKEGFLGMSCSWYITPNSLRDPLFSCVSSSQQDISDLHGRIMEASVTIPENLFKQLQDEQEFNLTNNVYNILVSMHSSSKLFSIDEKRYRLEDVTTDVVGLNLVDVPVTNLSNPVIIKLRTPATTLYEVNPFVPVWWDFSLNNGSGSWSSEGCHFRTQWHNLLEFSCNNFGYYGLLQDISNLQNTQTVAKFKLSHPAIYVGTFIMIFSFLIAILTYLLCYTTIQMPKKTKHSLINTWIVISLLSFMYVFGIYQTEDVKVCQIVGMILHYFTLCSLLWMCVSIDCMYKKLRKNDIITLQDDELPSDEPIKKSMLGLYLVGYGIGLIICGLSAAINMNEYASPTYCFLRTGPALGALYIPVAILLGFLFVFSLLIRCAIYNLDANGHLSEGTQATEHVDLDLLDPNFPSVDVRSNRSVSTKTASSEVEDPEHSPSAQLKAYAIFLFIFVMTWMSCAFATVSPFHIVVYEESLFSIAFSIMATTLSAFTLFFYCVARNDVRSQWALLARWMKRNRFGFRSRSISDTIANIPQIQIQPLPLPPIINVDNQITSRSTSRSSSHTKSNSHNSNILKGAVDLNGSFSDHHGAKINNVNLVVLHRAQYRTNIIPNIIENPTNAAEVFYNPHQSTVARKFFKRQKRNMMKKTNLVKPPRDVNSDTASIFSEPSLRPRANTEQNIFGTNSKVNNTNIHVEHIHKVQQKNPNIFSDGTEDFDSISNDNVKLDKMKKKDFGRHPKARKNHSYGKPHSDRSENNMRSVSQQCTLEYSSETISDSILDKASPEKNLLPIQNSFVTETSQMIPSVRRDNSPLSMLTENMPHYCHIDEIHKDTNDHNGEYFQNQYQNTCRRKSKPVKSKSMKFDYGKGDPLCASSSAKIYINPSHDIRYRKGDGQSQASSVSVSDLDELYQQIRRGPATRKIRNYIYHASPCLSDSEINSFVSDIRQRLRASYSHDRFDLLSDDVETTV